MILDFALSRFKDCLGFLVQPTDNTFAQLDQFAQKLHQAMAKITEFTKQVMEEEEPEPEKTPSSKKKPAKETPKTEKQVKDEEKASQELTAKLDQCYEFRKELEELCSVPAGIVSRVNQAANVKTDTSPDTMRLGLMFLLNIFQRFLDTVNSGDERNTPPKQVRGVLEHPHAKRLAEAIEQAKVAHPALAKGGKNKVRTAVPNKTFKRTLTRPK